MIGFFKNRIFRGKVLLRIEELCLNILGKDDGEYAMALFAMQTRNLVEWGKLNMSAIMAEYRRSRHSIDEAAVLFIDGTVTQLKQTRDGKDLLAEDIDSLNRGITLLEKVVDKAIFQSMGKIGILPRNGKFAQSAEKHGLDQFFTS